MRHLCGSGLCIQVGEAIILTTNDMRVATNFLQNNNILRLIYVTNYLKGCLSKYGVRVATTYHPM